MSALSICLIGCGGIANIAYADSLIRCQKEGRASLLACCDMDASKADAYRERVGFSAIYTDYIAMLEAQKPDAVILTTPFTVTAAIAGQVLELGYPLLLEKPPGNSLAECKSLAETTSKTGTLHQVAFNRRHLPLITLLREEFVEKGSIIQHIDYCMYRINRREDHFHTTAIHGVDLVRFLAGGDYRDIHITVSDLTRHGTGIHNFLLSGDFTSGVTAQLSFCPMADVIRESITVIVDGATYDVDLPMWNANGYAGALTKYHNGERVFAKDGPILDHSFTFVESNGFYHQLVAFLNAVSHGHMPRDVLDTAIDSMAVADRLASMERGKIMRSRCNA